MKQIRFIFWMLFPILVSFIFFDHSVFAVTILASIVALVSLGYAVYCYIYLARLRKNNCKKRVLVITGFRDKEVVTRGGRFYYYCIIGYFTDDPTHDSCYSVEEYKAKANKEHNIGDIIEVYDVSKEDDKRFTFTGWDELRSSFLESLTVAGINLLTCIISFWIYKTSH